MANSSFRAAHPLLFECEESGIPRSSRKQLRKGCNMFGRNKNGRDDSRRYSRTENAGYEDRFGPYGMRGRERRTDADVDAPRASSRMNQGYYSDYASFEGTT